MEAKLRDGAALAAVDYVKRGWHVVPNHFQRPNGKGCSCRLGVKCEQHQWGKHPIQSKWQENAFTAREEVHAWWAKKPLSNVGVMLGPKSGIIDVEFDTDEGKATADRVFAGVKTPTYKSGRSIHRIFKWTDDLPRITELDKGTAGLEFRISGDKSCQSVFPPSKHWSGKTYEWLPELSPDDIDPIPLPREALEILLRALNGQGQGQGQLSFDAPDPGQEDVVGPGPQDDRGLFADELATAQRPPSCDILDKKVLHETVDKRDESLFKFLCREARKMNDPDDPQEQKDLFEIAKGLNLLKCKPVLDEHTVWQKVQQALKYTRKDRAEGDPESLEDVATDRPAALAILGEGLRQGNKVPCVVDVIQRGRTDAHFEIVFNHEGEEVAVDVGDAETVFRPWHVQGRVAEALHIVPQTRTKKQWHLFAEAIITTARVVETTSENDETLTWLRDFIDEKKIGDTRMNPAEVTTKQKWGSISLKDFPGFLSNDGEWFISATVLANYITMEWGARVSHRGMALRLSRLGFVRHEIAVRLYKEDRSGCKSSTAEGEMVPTGTVHRRLWRGRLEGKAVAG